MSPDASGSDAMEEKWRGWQGDASEKWSMVDHGGVSVVPGSGATPTLAVPPTPAPPTLALASPP